MKSVPSSAWLRVSLVLVLLLGATRVADLGAQSRAASAPAKAKKANTAPADQSLVCRLDLGNRTGRCYLTCHGRNHNPFSY